MLLNTAFLRAMNKTQDERHSSSSPINLHLPHHVITAGFYNTTVPSQTTRSSPLRAPNNKQSSTAKRGTLTFSHKHRRGTKAPEPIYVCLALSLEYLHHPDQTFLDPPKTRGHQALASLLLPLSTPDSSFYPGSLLTSLHFVRGGRTGCRSSPIPPQSITDLRPILLVSSITSWDKQCRQLQLCHRLTT